MNQNWGEKKKVNYSSQDAFSLLIEAYREIENFRDQTEQEASRNKKAQSLLDLIESMCSVETGKKDINKVLQEKLLQIVDALSMEYGGTVFLAPIDIPQNISLGGKNKEEFTTDLSSMEFIHYVWSTNTQQLLEEMKQASLQAPRLSKAPNFQLILLSKRYKILDPSIIHLPEGHFELKSVLLVPVVVNKQSVALLGMANGNYSKLDGEILMEVLPRVWTNIILESVSKANKQMENMERFKRVEQKIEFTKKMTIALNNAMKQEDDDQSFVSKKKYLHKKLKDMANFFESHFGGMVFVAPTMVATNLQLFQFQSLSGTSSSSSDSQSETEEKPDPFKFLNYVFSDSATTIRKTVMKSFKKPVLAKAKVMLNCVKSGQPLILQNASTLDLPPGHFPLTSVLLSPIMQNGECVALVGCANGKYAELDAEVLCDVLSTSWFALMQEIFSRIKEKMNMHKGLSLVDKISSATITVMSVTGLNEVIKGEQTNYRNVLDFLNTIFLKYSELCSTSGIHRVLIRGNQIISVAPYNQLIVDISAKIALMLLKSLSGIKEKHLLFKNCHLKISICSGQTIVCGAFGKDNLIEVLGDFVESSIVFNHKVTENSVQVDEESLKHLKEKYTVEKKNEGYYQITSK